MTTMYDPSNPQVQFMPYSIFQRPKCLHVRKQLQPSLLIYTFGSGMPGRQSTEFNHFLKERDAPLFQDWTDINTYSALLVMTTFSREQPKDNRYEDRMKNWDLLKQQLLLTSHFRHPLIG